MILLGAICALALALRLPHLLESVWYDELWATRIRLSNLGMLVQVTLGDVHPPAYGVFMFVWIRLFGDSELSVRLPSLLAGLATLPVAFALTKRMAGAAAGLIAAFLLAVSPVHIWYSQEARAYSGVMFLSLLAILMFYRVTDERRPTLALWILGLSLCGAILAHYYTIAVVATIAAIAIARPTQYRPRLLTVLGVVSLACVGFAAFKTFFGGVATSAGYLRPFTLVEAMPLLSWLLSGNTIFRGAGWLRWPDILVPSAINLAAIAVLIVGLAFVRKARSMREATELFLLLVCVPALLLVLPWLGFTNTYIERSALPVLPLFLTLIAIGAYELLRRRYFPLIASGLAVVGLLPAIRLHQLHDVRTVYKPNPDWRSAALYLRQSPGNGEPIVIFVTSPATELQYYGIDVTEREAWVEDVVATGPVKAKPVDSTDTAAKLKRRLNDLTAFRGRDAASPSSAGARRHEAIIVREWADSIILGVLKRTGSARFFIVHNRYWSESFPKVLGPVVESGRYPISRRVEFKGLVITEHAVEKLRDSAS